MALLGCYHWSVTVPWELSRTKHTQGQTMGLPGCEIIRAVHRDTTALLLLLGLVFAKPEELARVTVNGHSTGVGVEEVALRVIPTGAGDDVLAGGRANNGQSGEKITHGHLGGSFHGICDEQGRYRPSWWRQRGCEYTYTASRLPPPEPSLATVANTSREITSTRQSRAELLRGGEQQPSQQPDQ